MTIKNFQLARHPDRPYAMDYIHGLLTKCFMKFHGDRHYVDDHAIVCYLGYIGTQKVLVIGEQKEEELKTNYIETLVCQVLKDIENIKSCKMADKFQIPILMLVDTPGAYPGIGAEERNQSEAIARNLYEFVDLTTPTVFSCNWRRWFWWCISNISC